MSSILAEILRRKEEEISLLDIVQRTLNLCPTLPSFVRQGRTDEPTKCLSRSDTWRCIGKHRTLLQDQIDKVTRSDGRSRDVVIAYLSSNTVDMFLSILASTSLGGGLAADAPRPVSALLNIRWTSDEMSQSLQSKNPNATTILLYGQGFDEMAKAVVQKIGHNAICLPLAQVSPDYWLTLTKQATIPFNESGCTNLFSLQDVEEKGSLKDAIIVFTSGTTGGSKGVRLSHRALAIQSLTKLQAPCHYSNETVMLASTVPLFHVGGLSSCLAVLFAGGSLAFSSTVAPGFDPTVVQRSLRSPTLPINSLVVVPAMLVALFSKLDRSAVYPKVRLILIGGQSASDSVVFKLRRFFPNARIVQTYACTEAASSLTFLHVNANANDSFHPHLQRSPSQLPNGDCVGRPPSHVHLRLYHKEGKTTKIRTLPYQAGIIATRGPHLMNGYWDRGSTTPPKNLSGWYLTSDLGFWDDHGQLHFCGRVKDVIRTGGETVMAQEIESALLRHPAIEECAVFGRPDDLFGEAVSCALVATQPLELGTIKAWCLQQGLASYKRPRHLFLVHALPRNSSGKVLKHQLVKRFGTTRIQSRL